MDANELATIAIDAMPLEVLAPADKGQVWGVLQMALRTLEAQHESLLAEADNEAAEARKLLAAQISAPSELAAKQRELDDVSRERDAWKTKYYDKDVELAAVRVELGKLQAENARLHRSMEEWMSAAQKQRMPLHSHSEFAELEKERDELRKTEFGAVQQVETFAITNAKLRKELDSANADKGWMSDAILKTLPQDVYLKVFDAYHKLRGTYDNALPPGAVKVAPMQDETGVTTLTGEVTYPGTK